LKITKYKHPILKKKEELAILEFGGVCFVCKKKFGKGFSFHHLNYKKGRLTYKSFTSTVNYHKYVLPEIKKEPWRFILLCKAHHHFVEWGASIKNPELWRKFLLAVMMTDPDKSGPTTTDDSLETEMSVGAYSLCKNNSLKRLLETQFNINSMFGDSHFEIR
jgi:hypothetical protein